MYETVKYNPSIKVVRDCINLVILYNELIECFNLRLQNIQAVHL